MSRIYYCPNISSVSFFVCLSIKVQYRCIVIMAYVYTYVDLVSIFRHSIYKVQLLSILCQTWLYHRILSHDRKSQPLWHP